MLKVTTRSGAVYLMDGKKVQRANGSPHSPGINYDIAADGDWQTVTVYQEPEIGTSWNLVFNDSTWRVTTPVVSIEEV